ncbi:MULTISPECIES: hypothetical protein [Catenuloplanes]|uniref:Uncharacterized protein n=1 Tax=Catenuloplanes niger TaxID=587534 RepID=A0AAE4CW29_9ACTN|nr:hypothetical protein [Catenuloplanes niger]MDR7326800.1 hypothetical protein [Catenuloplanes niger]
MIKNIGGAAALALLAVLTWWMWLGRDSGYRTDVNGNVTGPYEAWQVIGAGVTLLIVLIAALVLRVHPLIVPAVLTLAFTTAWTIHAAGTDDSGLFAVGALLLLVGLGIASAVVTVGTRAVLTRAS